MCCPSTPIILSNGSRIWELLTRSEVFDQFLQLRFPNLKRYGLERGESMLLKLDTLFNVASAGMLIFTMT